MSELQKEISDNDKLLILARAAYQLLKKQENSSYVLDLLGESTVWDCVECDGHCLMNELEDILVDEYEIDPNYVPKNIDG
jgi:hypothetical protein